MSETKTAAPTPQRLAGKDQEFKLVPIAKVVPSKTNPRKTFDEDGIEKLAASMRETGIHEPLIMRQLNGHYEIVAGERRWKAAKKAGLEVLPAMVRDLTDQQALEIQIIENLQREDVHPLEEAEGYRALLSTKAYTVETLSRKIGNGKSAGYVYAKLKLASLTSKAKKAFLDQQIDEGHAVLIARLDPAAQEEALKICGIADQVDAGGRYLDLDYTITVKDLGLWIQREIYLGLEHVPWDKKDATLVPKAGACATCPKRAGNSPDLFGDVEKKETCTDRLCFQLKKKSWLARRRTEIEGKGHKVKLITMQYSDSDGLLGRQHWHQLESGAKPCEKTVKGLVGEGDALDKVLSICVGENCRTPGHGSVSMPTQRRATKSSSSSSSSGGLSPSAADELRREKNRIESAFKDYSRLELFRQVIEMTKKITREDLELLAVRSQGLPYLDGRKDPDWIPPDCSGVAAAAKATEEDLAKFLVASALGDDLDHYVEPKLLIAAARRHKINVEKVLEDAKARAKNEEEHRQQVKRWEGRVASQASSYDKATCKGCGCVEAQACPGGCEWVKLNEKTNVGLCSTCEAASKSR